MKTIKFLFTVVLISTIGILYAQNKEKIVIPLSDPGEPGYLEVSVIYGSIEVTGYSGKEVIVEIISDDETSIVEKDGSKLKKITVNSYGISAEEDNNRIEIHTNSWKTGVDLKIKVPHKFDLNLHAVNDGDVTVMNIDGKLEVQNINGTVTLTNVEGTIIASTMNGDLTAQINRINPGDPMSFTSVNGDIELIIPSSTKAMFKMKSDMGDIYTDLDLEIEETKPVLDNTSVDGKYQVKFEKWVMGKLNGGGPEFLLSNFNGDIIIREGK